MRFLYGIGVQGYGLAIRIASLFNPKARLWVQGRKNWRSSLPQLDQRTVIWFHCASLGEFDQGLPLMHRIRKDQPESFIVVTFFSPSGMQHYHKRQHPADHVMYMPLDTTRNARDFIQHFKPGLSLFVKYEFWANHIFVAKASGSRVFNISGLFREKHRFFRWYGGFFRKTLRQFEWFFVQNTHSLKLLQSIGITQASVSGDARFDRVIENSRQCIPNPLIEAFRADAELLIVGSSWPKDEALIAAWEISFNGKVLLAPHTIDRAHIDALQSVFPEAGLYTRCAEGEALPARILILDTIGQLANAYTYGDFAYVGGGFSGSLHNILEPAVFGLPVIFGPRHTRFPEAQQFIDAGIGFSVQDAAAMQKVVAHIQTEQAELKTKTQAFVAQNAGASDRMWARISAS
jgi:3-deoxy-D-manno-octulosonic-acid transferase